MTAHERTVGITQVFGCTSVSGPDLGSKNGVIFCRKGNRPTWVAIIKDPNFITETGTCSAPCISLNNHN
jgi:hypothetical protein